MPVNVRVEFQVESFNSDDHELTIRVVGDLDVDSAPALIEELNCWLAVRSLVVDLRGCDFLDSTGIRALLECRHDIGPDASMRIAGAPEHVERVLRISGIEEAGITLASASGKSASG
jgi:anti-sigma B factor antagonist